MKKQFLFTSAILFALGAVIFTGCKKDDTTPPEITLNGSASETQSLPATAGSGSYTDPGATANDDEDGVVTVTTTGTVDPNSKGTYTITYSATDAAGNSASATRTVSIVNDAEYLAGSYAVKDSVYNPLPPYVSTYTETITASSTVNNRIWVTKFGNYVNGAVYIDRTSSTAISLANQTVTCGSPANARIFSNTFPSGGTISSTSPLTMVLNYKEDVISPPSTANAISTWVKN